MNNQFDELTKSLAQSVTRRAAFKKFGIGLAGMALAALGLANSAQAGSRGKKYRCLCKNPPYWGCTTQDCFAACQLFCTQPR